MAAVPCINVASSGPNLRIRLSVQIGSSPSHPAGPKDPFLKIKRPELESALYLCLLQSQSSPPMSSFIAWLFDTGVHSCCFIDAMKAKSPLIFPHIYIIIDNNQQVG
jgi:hypothetical protein